MKNRFKTTFTVAKHLPGCPSAGRQAIILDGPCQECEQVEVEVPVREAMRQIFDTVGKKYTEADLNAAVRKQHAGLN